MRSTLDWDINDQPLLVARGKPSSVAPSPVAPSSVAPSWLGIVVYVFSVCLNYCIGYNMYKVLEFGPVNLTKVQIFGDIVVTSWFALGFSTLPWHKWEQLTCIGPRNKCKGLLRYLVWMLGSNVAMVFYRWLREFPFFQHSLNTKNLTSGQKSVYIVTFTVLGTIIVYWISKLIIPTTKVEKCCVVDRQRKTIFITLALTVTAIFVLSYFICVSENCNYHLHHWWFGFVLIFLSSTSLDNWVDYALQGIFWAFLLEHIINSTIVFEKFFV